MPSQHSLSVAERVAMSDRDPGGQSPKPENQTGKQLHDPPGSGRGLDDASQLDEINKKYIKQLESNPRGPLEDEVERKFVKGPVPPRD
ncbi:hypothetical protein VTJ83DRAFT_5388 [Remersonia thermophila]|uniref:Uncharacterized protein n=1 Tax=Remersonia thermophila TaxID=72144 RepID=A0ABR4D6P5_9PEZI